MSNGMSARRDDAQQRLITLCRRTNLCGVLRDFLRIATKIPPGLPRGSPQRKLFREETSMTREHKSLSARRVCFTLCLSLLLALTVTAITDVQAAESTAEISGQDLAQTSYASGAERAVGGAAASAAAARADATGTGAESIDTVTDKDIAESSAGSRSSGSNAHAGTENAKAGKPAASPKSGHLTLEQAVLVAMVIINAMALIFLAVDAWMRWH